MTPARAILCALAIAAATPSSAQQLPPGTVLGNFDTTQSPPYPVPTAIFGEGLSQIVSGLTVTLPTSGILSLSFFDKGASAGATCSSPTVTFAAGTQAIGSPALVTNPTGGAVATLITTGTAPNQIITGATFSNRGTYSFPPAVRIQGCTGRYKVDAVLDETVMRTVTTAAGKLLAGGALYDVPAYTRTYAPATTTCDHYNTATGAWVSAEGSACNTPPIPPHVLMQYVTVGSAPSWPNGLGDNAPRQVWQVSQIPGVVPLANRVWSVLQQGVGQASQDYRDYVCTLGVTAATGGCSFWARWFAAGSDDPSHIPYDPRLDGNNFALARAPIGRPPAPGDFGWSIVWSAKSLGSGDGVGINVAQMFVAANDPTDGLMRGEHHIAVAAPEVAGASISAWSFSPGLASWNYIDGPAPRMGADTISLHSRINFDGNAGGIYIDGVHISLPAMLDRLAALEAEVARLKEAPR